MSELHLVTMPKWGLSMEEGKLVAWHKQPGDPVAVGDELVEVETSKITNTIEAPVAGKLLRILAEPELTLACGAPLGVIGPDTIAEAVIEAFIAAQNEHIAQSGAEIALRSAEPVTRDVGQNGDVTRLRYLVSEGPADPDKNKPTVVLIHGFGGDLENWMFNQPALAAAHRVIAIDLPGHGGSGKRVGDGSAAALAAAVAPLIDDVAPGPIHLVAHSFGAMVARALFELQPERVASFTAIAPADLGVVNRAYIDGFLNARRRSDIGAAIALLFSDPKLATRDMAENLLRYRRLDGVESALRAIDAANLAHLAPDQAALAMWQTLGSRGLVIWGEDDAVVPRATTVPVCPEAGTLFLSHAGHMPHIEKADLVNAALAAHLQEHSLL